MDEKFVLKRGSIWYRTPRICRKCGMKDYIDVHRAIIHGERKAIFS